MVSKDIWLKSVKDDAGVYHMLNYTAGKEKRREADHTRICLRKNKI